MGLKSYKEWKKQKEFEQMLVETGILARLEALEKALVKEENKPLTDDEKKNLEFNKATAKTPLDFINQFTGEEEEFYPNGKPTKNN